MWLVIRFLIKLQKSQTLQQNNSGTVTDEQDKEIPNGRYTSPKEKQKIIDYLKLI